MTTLINDYQNNRIEYWEKGYSILSGIYSQYDVENFRTECKRLWLLEGLSDDLNLRTEFRRGPDNTFVFDRLDPVIDISTILTGAVLNTELNAALRIILGGNTELLKCKLIRKDPGVKGYAPHQDFLYWKWLEQNPDSLCSVAINLYDSDENSGAIGFYPGLHNRLLPGPEGNPEGDFDPRYLQGHRPEFPALAAGDVLVFHSLAPHYSGPNNGMNPRTILLPSYCVSDDKGLYKKYYQREIYRRCEEMVGFERYFSRIDNTQNLMLDNQAQCS